MRKGKGKGGKASECCKQIRKVKGRKIHQGKREEKREGTDDRC